MGDGSQINSDPWEGAGETSKKYKGTSGARVTFYFLTGELVTKVYCFVKIHRVYIFNPCTFL